MNTFRQIGLLIGLAASVAVGAAVVLWLWIPANENFQENIEYRNYYPPTELQLTNGERSRVPVSTNYQTDDTRFVVGGSTNNVDERFMTLSGAQLAYTQQLEASFTRRIERLLEPLVGAESIRAQVTADVDFTSHEKTLETYSPDSQVPRNKELEEQIKGDENIDKSETLKKVRRESNSYDLDKTISRTRSAVGHINNLSIAVVVDDKLSRGVKGNIIRTPYTSAELERITDLVKKAVGFNTRRGDTVNVVNAQFKPRRSVKIISNEPTWNQVWVKDLFNKILGTLLVLLIIFAVIRPATKSLTRIPPGYFSGPSESTGLYQIGADDNLNSADSDNYGMDDSDNYEKNMNTVSRVVKNDPKLVAQIMKNWVSADGT